MVPPLIRDPLQSRLLPLSRNSLALATGLLFLITLASCRRPLPPAADREAIVATIEDFHQALSNGDGVRASTLLAADAQVLESGDRQTREEYLHDHLPADLEFAKAVPSTRTPPVVRQDGNVAWTTSNSRSVGSFNGRNLDSDGTELMVLSKEPDGWRIRAIHWSGHSHR